MPLNVLILGAHSAIGRAIAHEFARHGHSLLLAGRQAHRLEADVSDLAIRYGVEASAHEFDATAYAQHMPFYTQLPLEPEVVICVFGYYGQPHDSSDWSDTETILTVNYLGAVSILEVAARQLEAKGRGIIIGIGSVAGDRGRAKNYLYGSAKAGFHAFLSGIRNRLYAKGVHVMTVKPGFVYTPMTAGMELPAVLTAQPAEVARDVYRGMKRKRNIIYTRWFWRYIMLVIRCLPESLFKRLHI